MLDATIVLSGEVRDISPSRPKLCLADGCMDATWRERQVSPSHHDNLPDKGRGISVKCGLGNSRILVSLRQCGLTPKEIMSRAMDQKKS